MGYTIKIWYDTNAKQHHSVYGYDDHSATIITDSDCYEIDLSTKNADQIKHLFDEYNISSIEYHNGPIGNEDPGLYGELATGTYSVNEFVEWIESNRFFVTS